MAPLNLKKSIIFLAIGVSFALPLYGAPSPLPGNGTIRLKADTAQFNQTKGEAIYRGHVSLKQNNSTLTAPILFTYTDNKQQLKKMVAKGNKDTLAHYTQSPQTAQDKPFDAKAKIITYFPQKQLILLEGNGKVTQGKDQFIAPFIQYNLQTKAVLAKGLGNQQTTLILHPKKGGGSPWGIS